MTHYSDIFSGSPIIKILWNAPDEHPNSWFLNKGFFRRNGDYYLTILIQTRIELCMYLQGVLKMPVKKKPFSTMTGIFWGHVVQVLEVKWIKIDSQVVSSSFTFFCYSWPGTNVAHCISDPKRISEIPFFISSCRSTHQLIVWKKIV